MGKFTEALARARAISDRSHHLADPARLLAEAEAQFWADAARTLDDMVERVSALEASLVAGGTPTLHPGMKAENMIRLGVAPLSEATVPMTPAPETGEEIAAAALAAASNAASNAATSA